MQQASRFDTSDCDEPAICGSCDGTGDAGRFGGLRCGQCHGSGELSQAADDEEARMAAAEYRAEARAER